MSANISNDLAQRVRELEHEVASLQRANTELQDTVAHHERIASNIPGMVYRFVLSPDGRIAFPYVSPGSKAIYGLEPEQIMADASLIMAIVHADDRTKFQNSIADSARTLDPWAWEGRVVLDGARIRWIQGRSRPERASDGTVMWDGVLFDITQLKEAEEEQHRLQEQVVTMQAAALRELSTPLIPISDAVMVMPLVGSLDTRRTQDVLDTLLRGVAAQRAQVAIMDITGVPVVDSQVANGLIRAAQAVRLLGAQVVLTGIRPEVAQTLVGLGVNLEDIVTMSTLQMGIAFAIRREAAPR